MSSLKGLWVRVRALLFREAVEEEPEDEIRFHLDMETEKLIRSSLSPDEARRKPCSNLAAWSDSRGRPGMLAACL